MLKKNKKNLSKFNKWKINVNIGLGLENKKGKKKLIIYNDHTASSFLPINNRVKIISNNYKKAKKCNTFIDKLDNYKEVPHKNFLKIDTQVYDLEVLKGSKNLLKKN